MVIRVYEEHNPMDRSWWLRGLGRKSVVASMQGLRVRIPPGAWMSIVNAVCCQVEISVTGRSFVQGSSIECVCVSLTVIRRSRNPRYLNRKVEAARLKKNKRSVGSVRLCKRNAVDVLGCVVMQEATAWKVI